MNEKLISNNHWLTFFYETQYPLSHIEKKKDFWFNLYNEKLKNHK